MVLETLDLEYNDIFVYSENRTDLDRNFKMIRKDSDEERPESIGYGDVCRHLADGRPKNVIAYRILSNLQEFEASKLHYGFVLLLDGHKEVIYFDPVIALREIEENDEFTADPGFRFRIQQIGLTSQGARDAYPEFREIYSFDLEAEEIKQQNDKSFAEIIFAFDDIDFANLDDSSSGQYDVFHFNEDKSGSFDRERFNVFNVNEEDAYKSKLDSDEFETSGEHKPDSKKAETTVRSYADVGKSANLSEFLNKVKQNNKESRKSKRSTSEFFDHSSLMGSFVDGRSEKEVYLKLSE